MVFYLYPPSSASTFAAGAALASTAVSAAVSAAGVTVSSEAAVAALSASVDSDSAAGVGSGGGSSNKVEQFTTATEASAAALAADAATDENNLELDNKIVESLGYTLVTLVKKNRDNDLGIKIRGFYKDKTVLLTGVTGLLGKVILERIMNTLSDVK